MIADTDMSEQEKLSWLILGRPRPTVVNRSRRDILIAWLRPRYCARSVDQPAATVARRFGVDEIEAAFAGTTSVSE